MKLIIELPKDIYREMLKSFDLYKKEHEKICYTAITNGTPITENVTSRDIKEIAEIMECDADVETKCKMFSNILTAKPHYFQL